MEDQAPGWETPYSPGGPADGAVKGFIVADPRSADLYFSTTNTVWKLTDTPDAGPVLRWSRPGTEIRSPSTPVFIVGGTYVYVGSGDGSLYRLDAADGKTSAVFPLGDQTAAVGSPTIDIGAGFLYVGTEAGVVYAVKLP